MACVSDLTQAEAIVLLAEARTAYHKLMTGGAVVLVRDQNGEQVQFSQASRAGLYAYILELQAIACPSTIPRPRGPARFFF